MKHFLVIAIGFLIAGCSSTQKQADVAEAVVTPPPPVVTKMEKCMAKDRLKFAWDKTEEAEGYKVYYGADLNQMESVIDAGKKPEVKIKNPKVEHGQLYYFAVAAYNKEKIESPKSDIIAVEICQAKNKKAKKL